MYVPPYPCPPRSLLRHRDHLSTVSPHHLITSAHLSSFIRYPGPPSTIIFLAARGETPLRPKGPSLWETKTPEEAKRDWEATFGHIGMRGTHVPEEHRRETSDDERKAKSRDWAAYFTSLVEDANKKALVEEKGEWGEVGTIDEPGERHRRGGT